MSRLLATAGTKVSVGPVKTYSGTEFTASDFTSGSSDWTLIGGTTNLGGAGDTSELITSAHIGDPRMRKIKGVRNAGTMELVCDYDSSDAGQIALIAAEKSDDTFAFKIEFKDAPQGGTPSTRYFVALVMSAREQFDEANNTVKLNVTLEIDSNIVRVAAAASGG